MKPVYALSCSEPWGTFMCLNIKPIENRGWGLPYFLNPLPQRVFIHAGERFDYDGFNWLCKNSSLWVGLLDLDDFASLAIYPKTGLIGELDIIGEVQPKKEAQMVLVPPKLGPVSIYDSPWYFGQHAFVVANGELYLEPIPCKGELNFFVPKLEREKEIA